MADDPTPLLGLTEDEENQFRAVAGGLGIPLAELLCMLARRVIESDRQMRRHFAKGIAHWTTGEKRLREVADISIEQLPIDIRESWCMWPSDAPFPWSAEECKAAVLGYEVRWPLGLREFNLLRGDWELIDGYASLFQSG